MALIGAFWIAGVIAAGLVVRHEVNEAFDGALRETTGQVTPIVLQEYALKGASESPSVGTQSGSSKPGRGHIHYVLRDKGGKILVRSEGAPNSALLAKLKPGFQTQSGYRVYSRLLGKEGVWVQVAQELHERKEAAFGIWIGLASPLLALLPIAAFAAWRTIERATQPISRVSAELERRSGQHLEPVDESNLPGELVPVIDAVNTLMQRLKAALETEREFAANAAHELRNPIASTRAQIQVLAGKLSGTAEQARAENIASSLGQLGRRIEKLLQMSRAESGLGHSRERSDLMAITDLLVDDYARRTDVGSRIKRAMGSMESCWVAMDQDAIAIVLRNALENAIAHGTRTDPIDVRVGVDHTVRVVNACPPIAPDTLAELKNRFRRGGKAPNANSGSGLGLAIVDTIMRQAGGSVELLSPARDKTDGFEIVLTFPGAI